MKQTNPPSVEQASTSGGTSGPENQAEETKDHPDSSAAEAHPTSGQQLKPESSEETQGLLPLGLATAPVPEESTLSRDADADAGEKSRDSHSEALADEVSIPPILLEGDEPVAAPDTGPGEKFATPSKPDQPTAPEQPISLPEAYGTGRLLLTARDPKSLYAHWDVSRQESQEAERSTGSQLVVRVHQQSLSGPVLAEEHLPSGQRHVFVPVESGPGGYVAQLGYYLPEGPWKPLTSSERAVSLQEPGPGKGPVEFGTLSFPLTGGAASAPKSSPAESSAEPSFVFPKAEGAPSQTHDLNLIPEFPLVRTVPGLPIQAIGTNEPAVSETEDEEDQSVPIAPPSPGSVAETAWTPASERILAEIIGRSVLRQKRIGSAEFEALMRGELNWAGFLAQGGVSSMAVAGLSSQDVLPAPAEQPGFWLNVNAELVIYGATDPTSTVTIAGRRIRLRPDGSFSYRFALPDGSYSLPVEGISAHGETRRAELEFYRGTRYSGQVGAHPQDPDLSVPAVENLI